MPNDADALRTDPGTRNGEVPRSKRVLVWDLAVRVFHWGLVAGIVVAWTTGGSGHRVHETVGFGITALLAFRIVWGFIGTRHARFRDFVTRPGTVLAYFKAHSRNHAPRHLGHNPAGGYMILALLGVIAVICATGVMQLTNRFYGIEWVEELHHYAAIALLVLVPLHVLGAIVASMMHSENLVAAMISGWKDFREGDVVRSGETRRERRRHRLAYIQFRARSRRGFATVVVMLAAGLSYGWYATMGRGTGEVANELTAAAAPPSKPVDQTSSVPPLATSQYHHHGWHGAGATEYPRFTPAKDGCAICRAGPIAVSELRCAAGCVVGIISGSIQRGPAWRRNCTHRGAVDLRRAAP